MSKVYLINLLARVLRLLTQLGIVVLVGRKIGISNSYDKYVLILTYINAAGMLTFTMNSEIHRPDYIKLIDTKPSELGKFFFSNILSSLVLYFLFIAVFSFYVVEIGLPFYLMAIFGTLAPISTHILIILNSRLITYHQEFYNVFLSLILIPVYFLKINDLSILLIVFITQQVGTLLIAIFLLKRKLTSLIMFKDLLKIKLNFNFIQLLPTYILSQGYNIVEKNLLSKTTGQISIVHYSQLLRTSIQSLFTSLIQSIYIPTKIQTKNKNNSDSLYFLIALICVMFLGELILSTAFPGSLGEIIFGKKEELFTALLKRTFYLVIVIFAYVFFTAIILIQSKKLYTKISFVAQIITFLIIAYPGISLLERIFIAPMVGHSISVLFIVIQNISDTSIDRSKSIKQLITYLLLLTFLSVAYIGLEPI